MERRLSAILAADVVGFTRLMAINEIETLSRLKNLRREVVQPRIREHKGRIVKLTGDGLLAEFPSIVEAVECAVEINDGVRIWDADYPEDHNILLRMGLHVGDIIVEGTDIYGDGVNLASRLEQTAEPGGICISAVAHTSIGPELKKLFEDRGEQYLKNIEQPVRIWHSLGEASKYVPMIGNPQPVAMPTVAVIPFYNHSSNRELNYLANILAEDIITLLARTPGFFVIASGSTVGYRSDNLDVRKIGHELGARYVVGGSIRPAGERIRINVELIDSTKGGHLWANGFEVDAEQSASILDDVTSSIVASLRPELTYAETQFSDRQYPQNPDCWSFFRKASAVLFKEGWNEESFSEAEQLYRQAIKCDPDFAPAHGRLSLNLALGHLLGFTDDPAESHKEAEIALQLGGKDSEVLGYAGCAIVDLGDHERGIDILEQAIELNPSNAQALAALGAAYSVIGNFEEAVHKLSRAIRISPRDPRMALWGSILAMALAQQGKVDQAIVEARASCRRDWKLHQPHLVSAALMMRTGNKQEAKSALLAALQIRPNLGMREISRYGGEHSGELVDMIEALGHKVSGELHPDR